MQRQLLIFAGITLIVLSGLTVQVYGQSSGDTTGWGTLNYAVPESPAFKILGVSPSNILRPATTRDIAVSVGNYLVSNGAAIPNNIAVAISPSIFNPKVPLTKYKQDQWWYNSAISFGTKQNSDKSYSIALGVSFKVFDGADIRLNDAFRSFVDSAGSLINASFDEFAHKEALKMAPVWKVLPEAALTEVYNAYNDSNDKNHTTVVNDYTGVANAVQQITNMRDSLKKALWNAPVLQIGAAGLLNSKDSLIKDIETPPLFGIWATYGTHFTRSDQLLIGLNWQDSMSVATHQLLNSFNAGLRLYIGRSDFKGYIQGEGKYMDHQLPTYDAAIGIETTFFGGLWLDFALGAKKVGTGHWSFNPSINFSFANGEKNKASKSKS